MDPHSSDFTEQAYEPRSNSGGGLRRLALLLPLVAAVPISIAVLSQRGDDPADDSSKTPPAGLRPTAGLVEEMPAPEVDASKNTEIVSIEQISRDLGETPKVDEKKEEQKPEEGETAKAPDKEATEKEKAALQAKADADAKAEEKKKAAEDAKKIAEQKKQTPKRPSKVVVKSGDTLYSLGRKFNVPAEAIARENRIRVNDTILKGQTLNIPTVEEAKRLMAVAPATKNQTPPPGPQPFSQSLTPVNGLAAAQPAPRNQVIQTQPTQQQTASVNVHTPAIGTMPRNRTSKPRTGTNPPAQQPNGGAQPSPNSQWWPHASGSYVPTNQAGQQQPAQRPIQQNSGATAVVPTQRLQPVSGNFKPGKYIVYRVQENDTLPSIAAGHSTTVGTIQGMNSGIRQPKSGQILIIPVDGILHEKK
ncbi:MAG: LysM repeat protein [Verrucomicrobiales bacterium]|jgi:LysM repeat protein